MKTIENNKYKVNELSLEQSKSISGGVGILAALAIAGMLYSAGKGAWDAAHD